MTHRGLRVTRRGFISAASATIAAPLVVPASALGRDGVVAPSERITMGVVGLGSRGFNLIDEFLKQSDARIVAVCDVDSLHHRDRPWGSGPAFGRGPGQKRVEKGYSSAKSGTAANGVTAYADYREVCSREDIDAVVVATPDHWHALCTLTALRAGKDVYCEKPVTHLFGEGQLVYREAAKRKAVFQTGSQQRSDALFRRAVEIVRNGLIGDVQKVEVGLPPGYDSPQLPPTIAEPPEHLDYDFWCGPAPVLPYTRARHHRWWRGHRAYGGGVLMDWIGHHNDIAHWALDIDDSGPELVEAVDWTFPDTDIYDTPHQYTIRCEYSGGVTSTISSQNTLGTKLIGDAGWVHVTRGKIQASDSRWTKSAFRPGSKSVYRSPGHARNFLDCVRSREECVAPAETAHRSITPGHLGYVSQRLGRSLRWDAEKEVVAEDQEANRLLREFSYRSPWSLSQHSLEGA